MTVNARTCSHFGCSNSSHLLYATGGERVKKYFLLTRGKRRDKNCEKRKGYASNFYQTELYANRTRNEVDYDKDKTLYKS